MEEAFIRAELFIKALQNCSPSTRAADVKAYVTALEKELKIIKKEAERYAPKPNQSWGFVKTKPVQEQAPEASRDQQAEKK